RAALLSSSPHGDLAQKHAENIAKSENIQKSAESTAYNKIKDPLAEASQAAKANSANMQSKFGAAGAPGQYGRTQTAQQLLTAQAQAAAAGK
ncbi:MAG: hypothetical protein EBV23_14545, partial [Flavobacteriia bacterium]|nr:hypothetical protein [Flavobacteriia bacterium]